MTTLCEALTTVAEGLKTGNNELMALTAVADVPNIDNTGEKY